MYKPKPMVKNPEYSQVRADKKSARMAKNEKAEGKELKEKETKQAMHKDMLLAMKSSSELSALNANEITDAISKVQTELSNVKLEVPELFDGKDISSAIDGNSKVLQSALKDIVSNINKIKLEITPTELAPHVKKLADSATKDNEKLLLVVKQALSELNQSVKSIELEQEQPVEWKFEVSRDKKGYIESVNALAYYGEDS